jgi:hypothetical protein
MDGIPKHNNIEDTSLRYIYEHIISFEQAWTYVTRQTQFGNIELEGGNPNQLYPITLISN